MVDLVVINCQAYFLHISIRLFVNLPWIVQVNLDFHQWREYRSTNDKPVLWNSSKVHLMNLQLKAYIYTEDNTRVTNSDNGWTSRKLSGSTAERKKRSKDAWWKGTEAKQRKRKKRPMAEAGWRVQLNIGRSTISSKIQRFLNSHLQSISHVKYSVHLYFWNGYMAYIRSAAFCISVQ